MLAVVGAPGIVVAVGMVEGPAEAAAVSLPPPAWVLGRAAPATGEPGSFNAGAASAASSSSSR
ncbi:unannotated protein [freshwater metagenome]|uniref:Unannotated protein n=1 Tax=freshwater metagenome TaxID=449393 RepID=A0A6J7R751_9ZZZZ